MLIDPIELSRLLGQKYPPTEQQATVIQADLGPMLVVAGAGAGKTETMAARVVWLVANGLINPDQVLGLTFTRKAAQQLGKRINDRLGQLAGIPDIAALDPSGRLANRLRSAGPTTSTYDAFAGKLVGEFGLLLPVEPSSRIISQTELYRIAVQVVNEYEGELSMRHTTGHVVDTLLTLTAELDNHMVDERELKIESLLFAQLCEELPPAKRQRKKPSQKILGWQETQFHRIELLPLVTKLKDRLKDENLVTFGEQMSLAARLAVENPSVGKVLRNRYKVVMLDEYQDTSHAQRMLLRSLFAGGAVTAVGDPMQSIYGWRGATAANLNRFVTDFAIDPQESAVKNELTISFRNPPEVLHLANAVATTVLGAPSDPNRPVQPLSSPLSAAAGDIQLGYFPTIADEREFVADTLAELYNNRDTAKPFTAAVLVRKNAHTGPIAKELQRRGIPYEIVGINGLLDVPEVADMVAVAIMLIRPTDSAAALRILGGPAVGLGVRDIQALARRAGELSGRASSGKTTDSVDPAVKLEEEIAEVLAADAENIVGLTDAIADLGEPEKYSEEGYRRLGRLSSQLRRLRQTVAAGSSLPDLFAEIERVMGIRTEVLSRENPRLDGAVGTIHLDKLHQEVANFATIPNVTLSQLLDYFTEARRQESGLELGEVQVRSDRVQILTVHKAKGLEWDTVCVLHANNRDYDKTRASTWLTNPAMVPSTLRGDAAESGDTVGSPVLDTSWLENRAQLEAECAAHIEEFRQSLSEESTRLFYVAVTRAAQRLIVTASALDDNERDTKPCSNFLLMKRNASTDSIVAWHDPAEAAATDTSDEPSEVQQSPTGMFPKPTKTVDLLTGADLVRKAIAQQSAGDPIAFNQDNDLFQLWEKDVTALIEEYQRLQSDIVEVELSPELTATDIVALKQNPEQFARRQRRPVPFKPNRYAKRGTEFHSWLEQRFGAPTLLDESELPGMDEEITPGQLQELKDKFVAGQFADRTPMFVEQPFEVSIDGIVIRGRMDAVFRDESGWHIVDWKTGQLPSRADMRYLMMQLAVYRIAWAQLQGIDPDEIHASFYYVRYDKLSSADNLPSEREIAETLRLAAQPIE